MSLAIFSFGVLLFLITMYGAVVVGGLLLTDRQLGEQPKLEPDKARPQKTDGAFDRFRALVRSDY
jgi:hypothetical protein